MVALTLHCISTITIILLYASEIGFFGCRLLFHPRVENKSKRSISWRIRSRLSSDPNTPATLVSRALDEICADVQTVTCVPNDLRSSNARIVLSPIVAGHTFALFAGVPESALHEMTILHARPH